MTRRAASMLALAALAACGDGRDPLCARDAGAAATSVRISCPTSLELGCFDGTRATVPVDMIRSAACDGAHVTTSCDLTSVPAGSTDVTCSASDLFGHDASCTIHVHATARGTAALACGDPAIVHCTGPRTPVTLAAPTVDTTCGGTGGTPTSDAPSGGYPVGTTTVAWTLGSGASASRCAEHVTVLDAAPPSITCPPGGGVPSTTPPAATVTDTCDDAVTVTAMPTTLVRGASTTVTYTARDASGNTASCMATFMVVDAPAVVGVRVLAARELEGVTAVTVAWAPAVGAAVTGYRLETAADPAGPWSPVATTTPDHLFLTDPALAGDHASYRVVTLAGTGDGGTSAAVLAHAVDEAAYDLEGQRVARVAFPTSLYAVVRHPRDLAHGPYPLVLMLHGNHGNCRPLGYPGAGDDDCAELTTWQCADATHTTTPNELGYVYLADTLAAKGYVVATVNANALNCRETGGETSGWIRERSQLLISHMVEWQRWGTSGGAPFGARFVGAIDTGRVGLFGHSRGGEAVAAVPDELRDAPLPGIVVGAIFSLAPTTHWTDPTPHDAPYAVLVPACDGDVSTLEGIALYDRKYALSDGQPQSQLFVNGANHDFFSTEWRFDDNGDGMNCDTSVEIGATAQQGYLEGALGSFYDHTIGTEAHHFEDFLQADDDIPGAIQQWAGRTVDVRVSYTGRDRRVVTDLTETGAPATNALGLPDTFSPAFYVARRCAGTTDCDMSFPHDVPAMFLSWMANGEVAHWGLGSLDATPWDVFSFRIVSRRSTLNGTIPTQDVVVRLVDADGTHYDTTLTDVRVVPHLYDSNQQREILQTERIDLARLRTAAPDLDLAHLSAFELEMSPPARASGSILVTDVQLDHD